MQKLQITDIRHLLIESVDAHYSLKLKRKLSEQRKKKFVKINIIDETNKSPADQK